MLVIKIKNGEIKVRLCVRLSKNWRDQVRLCFELKRTREVILKSDDVLDCKKQREESQRNKLQSTLILYSSRAAAKGELQLA